VKRALFIGGSSGIGLAAAELALHEGFEVIVASRNPERAAIAAEKIVVDLEDEGTIHDCFRRIGPIEHLICTTVARAAGLAREVDLAAARRAFETKFWGPFTAIRAAEVSESITLASGVAASTPMRAGSITASINGAIEALIKTLAVELAPVRVNAVAPGVIDTPLWAGLADDDRGRMFQGLADSLPTRRVGSPAHVAAAIVFLMQNSFVTGEVVHVDGGHRLAQP